MKKFLVLGLLLLLNTAVLFGATAEAPFSVRAFVHGTEAEYMFGPPVRPSEENFLLFVQIQTWADIEKLEVKAFTNGVEYNVWCPKKTLSMPHGATQGESMLCGQYIPVDEGVNIIAIDVCAHVAGSETLCEFALQYYTGNEQLAFITGFERGDVSDFTNIHDKHLKTCDSVGISLEVHAAKVDADTPEEAVHLETGSPLWIEAVVTNHSTCAVRNVKINLWSDPNDRFLMCPDSSLLGPVYWGNGEAVMCWTVIETPLGLAEYKGIAYVEIPTGGFILEYDFTYSVGE